MKKFGIEVYDKIIYFYTNSNKCIKMLTEGKVLFKTIPCKITFIKETLEIEEKENVLCYIINDITRVNIDKENIFSFLTGKEEKLFFPDLVYLLMCMFAGVFQRDNKYFIQASAVKYNCNDGLMFIGDPGSGKTTLAYLLAKETGGTIVSNDNILIGLEGKHLKAYAGSHAVQMRLGAIKKFCKELLPLTELTNTTKDEWDTKIYIDQILESNGLAMSDNCQIKGVYFINTNENSEVIIRQREKLDRILALYDHITKQVRSNRYVLTSFDMPIPSFEDEKYMLDRYNVTKSIVENVPIYDAKGDVLKLVKTIERGL